MREFMKNTLDEYLYRMRDNKQKGITFIYSMEEEHFVPYAELLEKCERLSWVLRDTSYRYCILQVENLEDYLVSLWGCILSGITPMILKVAKSKEDFSMLANMFKISEDTMIIADSQIENYHIYHDDVMYVEDLRKKSNEANPKERLEIKPTDTAIIQFSSGSTGVPKGVIVSHQNIVFDIKGIHQALDVTEEDSQIDWIPMTHNFGLIKGFFASIVKNNSYYLMPSEVFITNPLVLIKKIQQYRITQVETPNFGLEIMKNACMNTEEKFDFSFVKSIGIGSDMVSKQLCEDITTFFKTYGMNPNAICPGYGLSEATVVVSVSRCNDLYKCYSVERNHMNIGDKISFSEDPKNSVCFTSIGPALDNVNVEIWDDDGKKLEENYVGNIMISGETVAEGYYTIEGIKPLNCKNGWLDTGDIGFIVDGNLVITGRKKDIMIVNGKNLYPSDFVSIIDKQVGISKNNIYIWGNYNQQTYQDDIIVCLEKNPVIEVTINEIIEKVKQVVHEETGYDVADICIFDKFPRYANSKLMAQKIKSDYIEQSQEQENSGSSQMSTMEAVSNDESDVLQIIKAIYNNANIAPEDFIYEYAISSLNIIKIVNKINHVYGTNLGFRDWISAETFQDFIELVNSVSVKADLDEKEQQVTNQEQESSSLTNVQMAYLLGRNPGFELGGTSTHAYFEMNLHINIEQYTDCVNQVVKRHAMLRTLIYPDGKQQVLDDVQPIVIPVTDATMENEEGKQHIREQIRAGMEEQVFDTTQWPLFAIKAMKSGTDDYIVFFGIDMLIADGISIMMILKEIAELYRGAEKNELTYTFEQYVKDLRKNRRNDVYESAKEYWNAKIPEIAPAPKLPLQRKLSEVTSMKTKRKSLVLDNTSWKSYRKICEQNDIRPTFGLMTAFAYLLTKWSNQGALTLNVTLFNRIPFHPDVDQLIGDFTTLLLQNCKIEKKMNFWGNAKKIQDEFLESFEYRDYDGVNVIRDYAEYNGLDSSSAIMPVVFTSMLYGAEDDSNNQLADINNIDYMVSQTSQVYLDHQIMEYNGGIILSWDYIEELFRPETIDEMFSEYSAIINSLVKDEDIVLKNDKLETFYAAYNDTQQDIPKKTLQKLFSDSAKKYPDQPCIKYHDVIKTYKQVDEESDKIACYLQEKKIGKGDYVPVLTKRNIETIVELLGVLKAGAAYVPINEDYPEERIQYICEEIQMNLLFEQIDYNEIMQKYDRSKNIIEDNVDDSAYIIYTSGSTGQPKGVEIAQYSAANTIQDINQRFHITSQDRIIGLSSLSFDLSVYDVFGAFEAGAELVIIENQKDVETIAQVLQEEEITVWNSVPMIMEMLSEYVLSKDCVNACKLRIVMLSGDWISLTLPDRVRKFAVDDVQIISLGGATEASIWSIYYPIGDIKESWTSIPYGYPLANQTYYVLTDDLELCPIGVNGCLYIGGAGVAKQYFKDVLKTEDAFIETERYGRIYKTGDYGIMSQDGHIIFMGREDSQVKVQGYRVELAEIEKHMRAYEGIMNVIVLHEKQEHNSSILVAYVVADDSVDVNKYMEYLQTKLPSYMIPTQLYRVETIPVTANGKVDRKKLRQMDAVNLQVKIGNEEKKDKLTSTQETLLEIWSEITGNGNINVQDSFMAVGGNSLVLVNAFNKIRDRLYSQIRVADIFKYKNIADLARFIDANRDEDEDDDDFIF